MERCQARAARSQRNNIGCAIRAFVRLEYHRFTTGVSWFAAKMGIIRDAVRKYLANPTYILPKGATAQLVAVSFLDAPSVISRQAVRLPR